MLEGHGRFGFGAPILKRFIELILTYTSRKAWKERNTPLLEEREFLPAKLIGCAVAATKEIWLSKDELIIMPSTANP